MDPFFKELQESVLNEVDHMPFHMSRKCEKTAQEVSHSQSQQKRHFIAHQERSMDKHRSWRRTSNLTWSHSLDYQEPWWWCPVWQKGRSPRLTDGWKHNQVMAIYLLLRYKRAEQEGHVIAPKPQTLVNLINSSPPRNQFEVSANTQQWGVGKLAAPSTNSLF